MGEVSLEFIARLLDRVIEGQAETRRDIADFRADMEVQSAIIRRMDGTLHNNVGEMRALGAQLDRQRQKLDRLQSRVDSLEDPQRV